MNVFKKFIPIVVAVLMLPALLLLNACGKKSIRVNLETNCETALESQIVKNFEELNLPTNIVNAGYTFDGWFLDSSFNISVSESNFESQTINKNEITVYAKWNANIDTPYSIEHYFENQFSNGFTIQSDKTLLLTGTTGQAVNAVILTDIPENMVYNAQLSNAVDTIAGNGSTVLKLYYTYERCQVSFNLNGGQRTGGGGLVQQVKFLNDAIAPTVSRAGYTFIKWDADFTSINAAKTITAVWTANSNTVYKVMHYFENISDDGFTPDLNKTQTLYGTTDTIASGTSLSVTGFSYNPALSAETISKNIDGDGSTVLKVYYNRLKYAVTLEMDSEYFVSGSLTQQIKYQGDVAIPIVNRPGYTLSWDAPTTNITHDQTIIAVWNANANTSYYIDLYFENLEGGFNLPQTQHLYGTTDTIAIYAHGYITGYTINPELSTESGIITGDGNLRLTIYFMLNTYTISVGESQNGSITNISKTTFKFGETLTFSVNTKAEMQLSRLVFNLQPSVTYGAEGSTVIIMDDKVVQRYTTSLIVTAEFIYKEFSVILGSMQNGTIVVNYHGKPANATKTNAGNAVSLTIVPNIGYKLVAGSVKFNNSTALFQSTANYAFMMPAGNITVTAQFEKIVFSININTVTGGTITPSKTSAVYGDEISITIAAAAGYKFIENSLFANSMPVLNRTLTMPACNVELYGRFEKIEETSNKLIIPYNVKVVGNIISWDSVVNAAGYILNINGTNFMLSSSTLSYNLSAFNTPNTSYNIKLKAQGNSYYSDSEEITYIYYTTSFRDVLHAYQNTLFLNTYKAESNIAVTGNAAIKQTVNAISINRADAYYSSIATQGSNTSEFLIENQMCYETKNSTKICYTYSVQEYLASLTQTNSNVNDLPSTYTYNAASSIHTFVYVTGSGASKIEITVELIVNGNYISYVKIITKMGTANTLVSTVTTNYFTATDAKEVINPTQYTRQYHVYCIGLNGILTYVGKTSATIALPPQGTSAGYSVVWYKDINFSQKVTSPVTVADDSIFYARRELNNLTISYYIDDLLAGTETVKYGDVALNKIFTKSNSTQLVSQWYTSNSYNTSYNFNSGGLTSNLNLYAKTLGVEVTVKYYNGSTLLTTRKTEYGKIISLYDYKPSGYSFGGWFTETGSQWTSSTVLNQTYELNLYANVSKINYTLKFESIDESIVPDYTNAYTGDIIEFPVMTREGYKFIGWTVNTGSTYDRYRQSGNEPLKDSVMSSANLNNEIYFYQVWERITNLSITLNLEGGNIYGSVDAVLQTFDYQYFYPVLEQPLKDGFVFAGWYTQPNGQGTLVNRATIYDVANPILNLYAHWLTLWKNQPYSIVVENSGTYTINNVSELVWFMNVCNGTNGLAQSNFSGKTIKLSSNIDLAGYLWTPIDNFAGIFNGQNHIISNMTIYRDSCIYSMYYSSPQYYVGFFGNSSNAAIENLIFDNVLIDLNYLKVYTTSGYYSKTRDVYIGILASRARYATNVKVLSGLIVADEGYATGIIYNSSISNVEINIKNCSNNAIIFATIAAGISGRGNILNCFNTGKLIGIFEASGIANYSGLIANCYNAGDIIIYNYSSGNCTRYAGGIAATGSVYEGSILNCFNVGNIYCITVINVTDSGNYYLGGIIGSSGTKGLTISNCYNIGNVYCDFKPADSGVVRIGAIIGYIEEQYPSKAKDHLFQNNYYSCRIFSISSGLDNKNNLTGLDLNTLKNAGFYTTISNWCTTEILHTTVNGNNIYYTPTVWDFTAVWEITNGSLPILKP